MLFLLKLDPFLKYLFKYWRTLASLSLAKAIVATMAYVLRSIINYMASEEVSFR